MAQTCDTSKGLYNEGGLTYRASLSLIISDWGHQCQSRGKGYDSGTVRVAFNEEVMSLMQQLGAQHF